MAQRLMMRLVDAMSLACIFALGSIHAYAQNQTDDTGGVALARALLSVSDATKLRNQSIPQLYRLPKDDRLAEFLRKVWHLDRTAYPELAWSLLERPDVRIAFAQMWGQYVRNTTADANEMASTRAYAERFLRDPSLSVRSDAVGYLGALGNMTDLPKLVEICSTDALPVAINAAYSIRILAQEDSTLLLEQCLSRTKNEEVGKAIRSIMKELA